MDKKLQCVSFPRSGHHLFQRLLQANCPELVYCERYNHCKKLPCTDASTNFQKSHDFNLGDPWLEDHHYFVQFRSPYESITSWYSLNVRASHIADDSRDTWNAFLEEKIKFWNGFMQKWTVEFPEKYGHERFMNIEYVNLVENTEDVIRSALGFLDYSPENESLVTQDKSVAFSEFGRIINSVPKKQRRVEDFEYYDPIDIERVLDECSPHLHLFKNI